MDVLQILAEIVEVRERMHGRWERLMQKNPDAISRDELDESYITLLRARLELAQYKEKHA